MLTGIFCYAVVQSGSADGFFAIKEQNSKIAELRKQFPDAAILFDIDAKQKSIDDLKADIAKADTDIENGQADLGEIIADAKAAEMFKKNAEAELKTAEADLDTAKAAKKDDEIKKADDALTGAKDVSDKAAALVDAFNKEKDGKKGLAEAEADLAKLNKIHKKSKADSPA